MVSANTTIRSKFINPIGLGVIIKFSSAYFKCFADGRRLNATPYAVVWAFPFVIVKYRRTLCVLVVRFPSLLTFWKWD